MSFPVEITGFVRKSLSILSLVLVSLQSMALRADAAVDWPTIELVQVATFPSGDVVGAISARDGSGRLFMVGRDGRIFVWTGAAFLASPFLDITARTRDPNPFAESGLLGLAFSPDYATSGKFYVHYNRQSDQASVVSRFSRSAGDANLANPNSEEVLLIVPQASEYHKGGDLAFGPDGFLYISLGDDRQSATTSVNPAQRLNSLQGKILRLDVASIPPVNGSYVIPPSNPFVSSTGARGEIWASGLRNPWRFSFDRANGDLYVADVGENTREEINVQRTGANGGQNYGWPIREGTLPYGGNANTNPSALTEPVFDYGRDLGRSVIGGYVHRGPAGRMSGMYFFADYVSKRIWGMAFENGAWQAQVIGAAGTSPLAFAEAEDGTLYLVTTGGLFRLRDTVHTHTPVLWPLSNSFSNPVAVQVTTLTPGAVLYYTLDGSTPTETSPTVPADGIVIIDGGQTLRVSAYRAGLTPTTSSPLSRVFAVASPRLAIVGRNPGYGHLVSVSSTTQNSVFRYTLDGTVPTVASDRADGTVLVRNGEFLQVVAMRPGYTSSPVTFVPQPTEDHEATQVSTLAGTGEFGMRDGPMAEALFSAPNGIVWTPENQLFVTDYNSNESKIRRIDLDTGLVSTLCGAERGDVVGPLASARFGTPLRGICYDSRDGCLYVADTEYRKIKRIDLSNGTVSTVVVTSGAPTDVYLSPASRLYWSQFASIWTRDEATGLAVRFAGTGGSQSGGLIHNFSIFGGAGEELLALTSGIRRISSAGDVLPYIGDLLGPSSLGNADGPFASGRIAAGFDAADIVRDAAGAIYVTTGSSIRKITPGHAVRSVAGTTLYSNSTPHLDGPGKTARFGFTVAGLAVDDVGKVYVADTANKRIRLIEQADWDGDGVLDSVDATAPYRLGGDDGRIDSDGDLLANATEYLVGSDPADAGSALRPSITLSGGAPIVSWPTRAGILYLVEKSVDLREWAPLPASAKVGTGTIMEWTQGESLTAGGRAFFRVIPFFPVP
ncbi:MAG: PQQ-dependent sugar dehydrogenase [Burkholderiales bacterium]|nr:PQQ-dependent sugar dehydrogenase [Opitutaceae bacterium]